ncbi:hypothetical protein LTR28_002152 [Elasticomyces elasticus]|nr:hypothetical protein LTR28_002152 [Elasticomyces elasticus]
MTIRGTLKSVDQFLNIKLDDVTMVNEIKYPHLAADVDIALLEDAARRGKRPRQTDIVRHWMEFYASAVIVVYTIEASFMTQQMLEGPTEHLDQGS